MVIYCSSLIELALSGLLGKFRRSQESTTLLLVCAHVHARPGEDGRLCLPKDISEPDGFSRQSGSFMITIVDCGFFYSRFYLIN